jgi:SNF2 family DNA or RNA helicase
MPTFTPAPYQETAINHLLGHKQAALFMGLGLGKTASTLEAICRARKMGLFEATLVVAPLRVCNLTWPAEVEKWGFDLQVANLRTKAGWDALVHRKANLYLINYDALPKLVEQYLAINWTRPAFQAVAFDELTRAKNHLSTRINKFRRSAGAIYHRWGLTGTPNPNSYMELFAQIRLLDGGKRLGASFDIFRRTYFQAMDYSWVPRPGAEKYIQAFIADLALTLRSSDYLDIPDMTEEDIEVAMPEEAKKVYKLAEKEMLVRLAKGDIPVTNAAVLAGKLLQMTGGALYTEERQVEVLHDEVDPERETAGTGWLVMVRTGKVNT